MFYEVAVKTSIPEPSDLVKIKLLREAAVMVQFKHPNIVQLYGVVVQENKVSMHASVSGRKTIDSFVTSINTIHPIAPI